MLLTAKRAPQVQHRTLLFSHTISADIAGCKLFFPRRKHQPLQLSLYYLPNLLLLLLNLKLIPVWWQIAFFFTCSYKPKIQTHTERAHRHINVSPAISPYPILWFMQDFNQPVYSSQAKTILPSRYRPSLTAGVAVATTQSTNYYTNMAEVGALLFVQTWWLQTLPESDKVMTDCNESRFTQKEVQHLSNIITVIGHVPSVFLHVLLSPFICSLKDKDHSLLSHQAFVSSMRSTQGTDLQQITNHFMLFLGKGGWLNR